MNSLSASRFTMNTLYFSSNSPWIHFLPPNHYDFTIFFPKSLWIPYFFAKSICTYYLLRDFSLKSLSFSGIHYLFPELPIFSRMHLESTFSREITMNSLYSSRYHFDSTICFVISLWIRYHFHEINVNSLSISRFYYEFNIFSPKSLLIHFFIAETIWIHYFCRDFTMISLSAWWFHYEYRKINMISLSSSRNHYEYTINIAILRWIHYIFRVFTINL